MHLLGLFFFILSSPVKVNLEHLELFKVRDFNLNKMPAGYLLSSYSENAVLVFDSGGKRLASFNKSGQGPDEIFKPVLFKVDGTEILIQSGNRSFLLFDHALNLSGKTVPSLPPGIGKPIGSSTLLKNNNIIIRNSRSSSYLLSEISLEKDDWVVKARYFKNGYGEITERGKNPTPRDLLENMKSVNIHNHYYFFYRSPIIDGEDEYKIMVFDQLPRNESEDGYIQILHGPFDAFKPYLREAKGFIRTVCKIKSGYMVEFVTRQKDNIEEIYWDYFSNEGGFEKRVKTDDQILIPVTNSDEVFASISEGEEDYLIQIN